MATFKVLMAESRYDSYDEETEVLSAIGAEMVFDRSDDEDRLAALAVDVDAILVNLAPITRKVLGATTRCKCVSRYGVGYDNVDVDACTEKGICVTNVPGYCEEDVSDHAFALFMDCVRKISRKDRLVRQGQWDLAGIQPVHRICGRTFGLVGFGRIARALHRKLSGFNLARVLTCDPFMPEDVVQAAGAELVDLDTVCRESDYISLHAPNVPETRGMIGAAQLDMMKNNAILVNTSRGPLIDESALIDALKTGKIACAGLDVFISEPLAADSELRALENVTVTDHAGWYSEESIVQLKRDAARNVALVLQGQPPIACVNPAACG